MRINELVVESQLDELSPSGIIGSAAKGVGAVAGGVHGAWDKMKQGYAAGRGSVSGTPTATTPAAAPTTSAAPGRSSTVTAPGGSPISPANQRIANQQVIRSQIRQFQGQLAALNRQLAAQQSSAAPATSTPAATTSTPPAGSAATAQAPGGSTAFSNMGQSLAPGPQTAATSTGGTATTGATGVQHAASSSNPNLPPAIPGATNAPVAAPAPAPAPRRLTRSMSSASGRTFENIEFRSNFLGINL